MQKVAILLEYHTHGAPRVGNKVNTQFASIHIATGVSAGDIFGIADFEHAGATFITIANRLKLEEAEKLAGRLSAELKKSGIEAEFSCFYDE